MLRLLALTIAVTAFAAGFAYAQPPEGAKEGAAATSGPAARMARPGFNWEEAYKAAGASDEQMKKLKDLEEQAREARKGGDTEKLKSLRDERQKVLTDEQNAKVREHFRSMIQQRRGAGPQMGAAMTSAPAAVKIEPKEGKEEPKEAKEPEKKSE